MPVIVTTSTCDNVMGVSILVINLNKSNMELKGSIVMNKTVELKKCRPYIYHIYIYIYIYICHKPFVGFEGHISIFQYINDAIPILCGEVRTKTDNSSVARMVKAVCDA